MTGGETERRDEVARRPRALLEGLAGGAASGAWLAWVERSPVWSKFADVLNAAFRILARFVPDTVWTRLDTETVALALYVGVPALFGAMLGVLAGAKRAPFRILLISIGLGAVELVALFPIWRHRELPLELGVGTIAIGALSAFIASTVVSAITRRLPRRWAMAAASVALSLVIVGSLAVVIAAGRGPSTPSGSHVAGPERVETNVRVAILAFDGLDGLMIDDAVDEGRLPHFAELMKRGVRGDLRSIRPPKSPVVWTSIATGMLPDRHGIHDFVTRSGGVSVPVTGNLRRVPALWDLSVAAEYSVAFVDWYVTWPAEPVRGLLVSDRVDYEGLDRRVFPESFTAVVDSARARVDARDDRDVTRFLGGGMNPDAWRDRQWGQVRRSLRVLDEVVRHDLVTLEIARTALRDAQPDLTALYFRGNDNTQHLFWKYRLTHAIGPATGELFSELEAEDAKFLAPVIDRYYDFADRLLGDALSLLDPETTVFVVSDHGFLTKNEIGPWTNGNAFLAEVGLAVLAAGSTGEADSTASRVYDEAPPSTDTVRVFRAGGTGGDALKKARETLAGAKTETGASLFRRIVPGEDERGDLLRVEFPGRIDGDSCRVGDRTFAVDRFRTREAKSGDHRMNGILIAAGPPIRRDAHISGARAVDVAPTVLHLLGAPAAQDMEGVVLVDLLDPTWRDAHPIRYVDTYGSRDEIDGDAISSDADERIREELRALGYIQ